MTSLGSNFEGILAHAAKDNDPIRLRRVREETAQTVSLLGTTDGHKLRTGQVIRVANPSLDAGKVLKGPLCVCHLDGCSARELVLSVPFCPASAQSSG